MFTGLIQQTGKLLRAESIQGGLRLAIEAGRWDPPLQPGESVAVNGVCLTAAAIAGTVFACDLLQETEARTTLGSKRAGARLNLERALRLGDTLGGHWVTGHVDGQGTVQALTPAGRDRVLRLACAPDLLRQMVPKGSIAVDGVSLTLADLNRETCAAHLIPFTWDHTALGELEVGAKVNLETDALGKYVYRYLETRPAAGPITLDTLRQAGFTQGAVNE